MVDFQMSFKQNGNNGVLTYKTPGGSGNVAYVRISKVAYEYSVQATESQTRLYRAFYPHRRVLGTFTITVQAIGYREYRNFLTWLQGYTSALLKAQVSASPEVPSMTVQMSARRFHRVGILTGGMADRDNKQSMVFEQQLHFITVKDYNDPNTSILKSDQASRFRNVTTADAARYKAFYPSTVSGYRDTDSKLYDLTDPTVNPPQVTPEPPSDANDGGPNDPRAI